MKEQEARVDSYTKACMGHSHFCVSNRRKCQYFPCLDFLSFNCKMSAQEQQTLFFFSGFETDMKIVTGALRPKYCGREHIRCIYLVHLILTSHRAETMLACCLCAWWAEMKGGQEPNINMTKNMIRAQPGVRVLFSFFS